MDIFNVNVCVGFENRCLRNAESFEVRVSFERILWSGAFSICTKRHDPTPSRRRGPHHYGRTRMTFLLFFSGPACTFFRFPLPLGGGGVESSPPTRIRTPTLA